MTDDESKDKSSIEKFAENFNLPKLLAGHAGDALSRLIGAGIGIPVAKLEQISQGIKDKTDAKSLLTRVVAEKTAEIAVSDPELLQRAKDSFVSDILRKQENKEAVAAQTIQHLGNEELPEDAPPVDDDWMNVFSRYAEDAASENLRDLWGKVLAGEIRKTASFSLRTLRFISELDRRTAVEFEKLLKFVSNGIFIFQDVNLQQAPWHTIFLSMVEAGLLRDFNFVSLVPRTIDTRGVLVYDYLKYSILISGKPGAIVHIQATMLTNVGQELAKIVDAKSDIEHIERVARIIPRENLTDISICHSHFVDGRSNVLNMPIKPIWKSSSN